MIFYVLKTLFTLLEAIRPPLMNCSNHDNKHKKKKKEEEEEKRVVVLLGGQHTKGKRIISISFAHLLTITDSSESFFHCLLSSQLVIESGCGGLGPKNSSIILNPPP